MAVHCDYRGVTILSFIMMIRAFKKGLPHNYLAAELLTWQHMMPVVNSQQMGWPLILLSDFKVIVKSHFCCGLSRCQCVVWFVCLGSAEEFNLCCWPALVFAWAKIRTFNAFLKAWTEGEKQETEGQKKNEREWRKMTCETLREK